MREKEGRRSLLDSVAVVSVLESTPAERMILYEDRGNIRETIAFLRSFMFRLGHNCIGPASELPAMWP